MKKPTKQEVEKWYYEEVKPLLKEYKIREEKAVISGYGQNQMEGKGNLFWKITTIFLGISLLLILYYGIEIEAFKGSVEIIQNITQDVNFNLTNEIHNDPFTVNKYANNFTIINQINCFDLLFGDFNET